MKKPDMKPAGLKKIIYFITVLTCAFAISILSFGIVWLSFFVSAMKNY